MDVIINVFAVVSIVMGSPLGEKCPRHKKTIPGKNSYIYVYFYVKWGLNKTTIQFDTYDLHLSWKIPL